MPVVKLYHYRLKDMLKKDIKEIVDVLPYIGLDIEEEGSDYIKVEYNPNRPDFATDYGIVRALKGLFGIEEGIARYKQTKSNVSIKVNNVKVRPYIVSLLALNGKLDDESIRQIITLQEDLHQGIGRNRKIISIGIHNYDNIKTPLLYTLADANTKFIPLNEDHEYTLKEILEKHELGKMYGWIIKNDYPIIKDAKNNIISFPPIINSDLTKVDKHTTNLLIEITATNLKIAEDALSILAITLFDAGFNIKSVKIEYANKFIITPNMNNNIMNVSSKFVNDVLGLQLSNKEIIKCLRKTRFDAKSGKNTVGCIVPRYRLDIISDIDIVEEIAIGYGIYNLESSYPLHKASGNKDPMLKFLDQAREVMIGLNAIENINFNLISKEIVEMLGLNYRYEVEHTKSKEHQILRPSLIPSLLKTLSVNIHSSYPQIIFEIGKTFEDNEEFRLALLIASNDTNYTQIKSYLQAFIRTLVGKDVKTVRNIMPILKEDASANIIIDDNLLGFIGEIKDKIRDELKLRVNVTLFELSLSKLYYLS